MASKLSVTLLLIGAIALTLGMQSGCARLRLPGDADYRTVASSTVAKPRVARRKHEKAIDQMCNNCYPLAEQLLHEALIADASFGPAHNTLGKLYYDQRKFYLAAWEFEHAIKAMPERAEPVNNLGLVYEAVGKLDDAVAQYSLAASMDPEKADYLGNWLRCRIRRGEHASTMRHELQSLIELDCREQWVRWAKLKLTTDRTGNDWRQSAFVSDFSEATIHEDESIGLGGYEVPALPIESEDAAVELDDPMPLIQPDSFSDEVEPPSSRRAIEDLFPGEAK